jgi:hypothetical protein
MRKQQQPNALLRRKVKVLLTKLFKTLNFGEVRQCLKNTCNVCLCHNFVECKTTWRQRKMHSPFGQKAITNELLVTGM